MSNENDDHSDAKPSFMMVASNERKERLKHECLAFFTMLPEKDFQFSEFQKHWNNLDYHNFNASELTTILTNSIAMLDRLEDQQKTKLRKDCLSEIMFRFECWETPATGQVESFDQHQLAVILRNYRVLNLNPSDEFLEGWYKKADPSSTLDGADYETRVVKSIASLAVARLKPSETYKEKWYPKAIHSIPYFRPGQVAFSLWAFARFGDEPIPEFLDEWKKRFDYLTDNYSDHFRQRDVANIVGASGVLHVITGKPVYKEIAEKAKTLINFHDCDLAHKRQLWLAHLWFDWEYPENPPPMDDRPSRYEQTIKNIFKHNGYPTTEEGRKVTTLNHKPDDNHRVNEREIFIEIDGRPHFLFEINEFDGSIQPAGYTGRTLFMSALIKKFEKDVVLLRIPSKVCDALRRTNNTEKRKVLSDLMNDAAQMPPGTYHVRHRRKIDNTNKPYLIRPLKIADHDGPN